MRDINMKELEKYNTVRYVANNAKANRKRACRKLSISDRHLRRLIDLYKQKGKEAFVHGNVGSTPHNKIEPSVRKSIVGKWEDKYYVCNNQHYSEKLNDAEHINVSREAVRRVLLENSIASKLTHKNTKKKIQVCLKTASHFYEDDQIKPAYEINPLIVHKDNQHCRLQEPEYYGEIVEIDASQEYWFGDSKWTLHLAVDKKGGVFLSGYFCKQETLTGYVSTTMPFLREFGIPRTIVTDNRGVFTNLGVTEDMRNIKLTQFGYSCQVLGIELITTSIPQRKPGIERANRTAQDRVVAELNLLGVKTVEKANELLPGILKDLNSRLNKQIDKSKSMYEPLTGNEDLMQIFSYKKELTCDNGNCIRFNNTYYMLYENNRMLNILKGTHCMLLIYPDGRTYATVQNHIYEARAGLPKYDENGKLVHPAGIKTVSRYTPPMSHPYKLRSFLEYKSKVKIRNVFYNEI